MSEVPCCSACGSVLESSALGAVVAEKDETIEELREECATYLANLKTNQRQLAALKRELADKRANHKLRPEAEEVWEYWRAGCKPRAREFGSAQFDAVVARLNAGHSVAKLKWAVDGAAVLPFMVGPGQWAARGSRQQWRADLEYICRSEKNLDGFIERAPSVQQLLDEAREKIREVVGGRALTREQAERRAFLREHVREHLCGEWVGDEWVPQPLLRAAA